MKWDSDFDDPPTYSQISATLWQGGTEDEDTTIRARKRLATVNDVGVGVEAITAEERLKADTDKPVTVTVCPVVNP